MDEDEKIGPMVMREKYWEEKTADEKIVKLAEIVELLGRSLISVENEVTRFRKHQHSENGEILVPFTDLSLEQQPWSRRNLLGRAPLSK